MTEALEDYVEVFRDLEAARAEALEVRALADAVQQRARHLGSILSTGAFSSKEKGAAVLLIVHCSCGWNSSTSTNIDELGERLRSHIDAAASPCMQTLPGF